MIRILSWLVVCVLAFAAQAHAGATSPTLVIGSAAAVAVGGVRTVVFEASLDFENAVQTGYGLQLIVFQGTRFVRYPLSGAPAAGQSAALADGSLAENEVAAVLAAGTPTAGRIVSITPRSLRVVVPADVPAGATTAILAAVLPEHPVVSNPIGFVLP
ncbi:MAG TPA: hypothetical protein VGR62_02215 [Candidatus Binatia bacterium]|nr:hypothetical protein [Candidatus Binatia bacterium]